MMVDVQVLRKMLTERIREGSAAVNERLAAHLRLSKDAERMMNDANSAAGAVQAYQKVLELMEQMDAPIIDIKDLQKAINVAGTEGNPK